MKKLLGLCILLLVCVGFCNFTEISASDFTVVAEVSKQMEQGDTLKLCSWKKSGKYYIYKIYDEFGSIIEKVKTKKKLTYTCDNGVVIKKKGKTLVYVAKNITDHFEFVSLLDKTNKKEYKYGFYVTKAYTKKKTHYVDLEVGEKFCLFENPYAGVSSGIYDKDGLVDVKTNGGFNLSNIKDFTDLAKKDSIIHGDPNYGAIYARNIGEMTLYITNDFGETIYEWVFRVKEASNKVDISGIKNSDYFDIIEDNGNYLTIKGKQDGIIFIWSIKEGYDAYKRTAGQIKYQKEAIKLKAGELSSIDIDTYYVSGSNDLSQDSSYLTSLRLVTTNALYEPSTKLYDFSYSEKIGNEDWELFSSMFVK